MTAPLVSILDDEPAIRSMLASALEEAGFRTQSFGRAREFEASLKATTPDVCLVDLSLPDRDGLSLVHRLALEQGARLLSLSQDVPMSAIKSQVLILARMITSSNPLSPPKLSPA